MAQQMCFDHKVRTFITRSDGVQKWCVGNRKNLGSGPLPNNARPGCWRVQIVTPFCTFTLTALSLYDRLEKSLRQARAEARFGSTHGLFSHVASFRITGQSPLVAWTTMNRRGSSWMRGDNQPVVPGPCKLEIPAACSPWSNQTMVTPSLFGRQWV